MKINRGPWRLVHLRRKVDDKIQPDLPILVRHVFGADLVGVSAVPDKRWKERLNSVLRIVASAPKGLLPVNKSGQYKTNINTPQSNDFKRAIKEGHLVMFRKKQYSTNGQSYLKLK
jgi:hypothetical protein